MIKNGLKLSIRKISKICLLIFQNTEDSKIKKNESKISTRSTKLLIQRRNARKEKDWLLGANSTQSYFRIVTPILQTSNKYPLFLVDLNSTLLL